MEIKVYLSNHSNQSFAKLVIDVEEAMSYTFNMKDGKLMASSSNTGLNDKYLSSFKI